MPAKPQQPACLEPLLLSGITRYLFTVEDPDRVAWFAIEEGGGTFGGPVDVLVDHDDVPGLLLLPQASACRGDNDVCASGFLEREQVGAEVDVGWHHGVLAAVASDQCARHALDCSYRYRKHRLAIAWAQEVKQVMREGQDRAEGEPLAPKLGLTPSSAARVLSSLVHLGHSHAAPCFTNKLQRCAATMVYGWYTVALHTKASAALATQRRRTGIGSAPVIILSEGLP